VERPLRVCLVGSGWFAQRAHCPALKKLCAGGAVRVSAVCSRAPANRTKALKKLGAAALGAREHGTLADAFDDADVDVVILALPRGAMASAVVAALQSGKHVISEKPGAWSAEEASKCWRAYGECGKCWCVSENWASKPGVLRVGHLFDVGAMPVDVSHSRYAANLRRRASDAIDWRETDCDDDE
jgi:predicted dehydrogenase